MNFRDQILGDLKKRNQTIRQQYHQIFSSYSDLIERFAALRAQNERLRKDGSADSEGPSSGSDGKELSEIRKELADLYKKKAQNDQQLIDTNNKLQTKERELAQTKKQLDEALHSVSELNKHNRTLDERIAEFDKTNQHLRDEYLALQATYNGIEEKYRQVQDENDKLISRWKDLKAKEVEALNQQNEEILQSRQKRMQVDLKEAAKQQVPVFDDARFALEAGGSDGFHPCGVGSLVPTRLKFKFEAHESEVNAITWSPSGKYFATGGADRKIKIWNFIDGKQHLRNTVTGCNQAVMSLCFDNDENQLLASSNDYASRIWTLSDQRCRHSLTGHSAKVLAAKFHSGSSQVVSGSHDRTIKLWDLRTGVRCFRTLFAGSSCNDLVTCEGSGPCIISGHFDKKLRFWDARNDSPIFDILLTGKITSLDLSLDKNYLLCCSRDDSLVLVDLRTNKSIHHYSGESFRVGFDWTRAVLSPDMEYCVAGSSDGNLFIWNVNSTKIEKILTKGHETGILSCSWNPDGQGIVSCDRHRTVAYWSDF